MSIRVLLGMNRQLVSDGMKAILMSLSDIHIVGQASNLTDLHALILTLRPQVLVADPATLGADPLAPVNGLRRQWPDCRVLVVAPYHNPEIARELLRSGVSGYITCDANAGLLADAVMAVHAGERFISSDIPGDSTLHFVECPPETCSLTNREREVIAMAAECYRNNDIAERLSISPRTVEVHRARAMRKLGLRSNTELVRYVLLHSTATT